MSAGKREQLFRRISGPQLSSLITLVEFRNFTHAAKASGVSQPTMHRAARTLERTLVPGCSRRPAMASSPPAKPRSCRAALISPSWKSHKLAPTSMRWTVASRAAPSSAACRWPAAFLFPRH